MKKLIILISLCLLVFPIFAADNVKGKKWNALRDIPWDMFAAVLLVVGVYFACLYGIDWLKELRADIKRKRNRKT